MPTWAILTGRWPVPPHCDLSDTATGPVRLRRRGFGAAGGRFDGLGRVAAIACVVSKICCGGGLMEPGKRAHFTTNAYAG
jgi:hypothetical protein